MIDKASVRKNREELEYAIQYPRWMLRPLGIWPLKSSYSMFFQLLSITVCVFLLVFLAVPCCLQIFLIEKDLGVRLKMVGPLSFCFMSIYKYFAMLLKDGQIRECLFDMMSDWRDIEEPEQRDLQLRQAKNARFFTGLCVFFMFGGGMSFSTIMPLTSGAIVIGNVSYRHLTYPSYFVFFNPHVRPIYDLVFITHCFCGVVMYSVTCGVCSIASVCIMHICGQCDITCLLLQRLTSENADKRSFEKIVQQHLHSLMFASKLENILNDMCMVEVVGCTFNICMLGYYFITEFENNNAIGLITFLLILTAMVFNIFIFCFIGDYLIHHCKKVGDAAYAVKWYEFSNKEARNIVLIIVSAQKPVVLTAGKMITLSIGSFCNVIKASVTYLNMLRTLIASDN